MDKPFQGLTFCCTGIQSTERHDVAEKIVALGGTHYTDLMSLVMYLVVGSRNTEKYRYSIRYRHDVTFLAPSAITDIHLRWVQGHDSGLGLAERVLPVFSSFVVCVARIERPPAGTLAKLFAEKFRTPPAGATSETRIRDAFLPTEIIEVMAKLGAKVSTTLTPHCNVLVGTDTAGRRYTMAAQWGVPAVHPLWVFDSCLRGAALDLDDYVVSDHSTLYNNASFVWRKLYAWRTEKHTVDKRERGPIKKSLAIWSSIMDQSHSHLSHVVHDSTWDEAHSDNETESPKGTGAPESASVASDPPVSALFLGFRFLPVGYLIPQQKVLKRVVESRQGELAESGDDSTITHVLVLVKNGPQASLMLLVLSSAMKRRVNNKDVQVVTDWFIERSIFYNRVCQDLWSRPLPGLVPLPTRYKVCVSGFTGVELLHIEKLVGYLNLEFCDVLNSRRDLLIVNVNVFKSAFLKNSPTLFEYRHKDILNCPVASSGDESRSVAALSAKNKISAAKQWNIPVVSVAYLWEMIEMLAGKAHLHMPDILDLTWCIFAPLTMARPTTLMDFVRKMSNNFLTQSKDDGEEDSVLLPSPRKSKNKQKYGRLAGGGESLTEQLKRARDETPESNVQNDQNQNADESFTELTQVGYENQESLHSKQELMKKLEGSSERPSKRLRRKT